jgi:hypothetical protein
MERSENLMANFSMSRETSGPALDVSFCRECLLTLPPSFAGEISHFVESGETGKIGDRIAKVICLGEENHRFAWPAVCGLLSPLMSAIQKCVRRWTEEERDAQDPRSAIRKLSGPNSALGMREGDNGFNELLVINAKKRRDSTGRRALRE